MTGRIERIDAEVEDRTAAAEFAAQPPGARSLLVEEPSLKRLDFAEATRVDICIACCQVGS